MLKIVKFGKKAKNVKFSKFLNNIILKINWNIENIIYTHIKKRFANIWIKVLSNYINNNKYISFKK